MVKAMDNDLSSISVQNQVQLAQRFYSQNINELNAKHEAHLEETVQQFTTRWEDLYSSMKEAEKIIEEIETKRKRDRKQIEAKYEQELQKVHANYKSQIDDLKSKVIDSELVMPILQSI